MPNISNVDTSKGHEELGPKTDDQTLNLKYKSSSDKASFLTDKLQYISILQTKKYNRRLNR